MMTINFVWKKFQSFPDTKNKLHIFTIIAEKYYSDFKKALKLRAGLPDVLSTYKELYYRNICGNYKLNL